MDSFDFDYVKVADFWWIHFGISRAPKLLKVKYEIIIYAKFINLLRNISKVFQILLKINDSG